MLKQITRLVAVTLLLTLGGCTQICVEQGIKPIFLPRFITQGLDQAKYEAPWQEGNGLSYFINQAESWRPDDYQYPEGTLNEYIIIEYDGYQQLIRYLIVPQDKELHPTAKGTLMLLQGWSGAWLYPFDKQSYLNRTGQLARELGMELLLVDLRGHGMSEASKPYKAASTYGDKDVDDLTKLLQRLGSRISKPVMVAGHSYGASSGTLLAIKNPDVVASINMSGLSSIDNVLQAVKGAVSDLAPESEGLLDFCSVQTGFLPALLTRAEKEYDFDRKGSSITALGQQGKEVPLLLIGGSDDLNVPIENLHQIKQSRPNPDNVKTVVYEKCDHGSYLPLDTMYDHIRFFLTSVLTDNPLSMPDDASYMCEGET
ncbi:alpha/beta fold hydrolase [Veronia pacifica]|uniref:AB hydrolase-1 domain-containing protein n=1 Tax=Veronia pacifica TaxID=1080227 RepID=A0A1C3ES21_9GAMM|nr:alpha/beta fold hydrolase [Veronia pacifica]ODA36057.1 hypothetical protein A8L45_00145 [Veronia pacifica]